MSDSPKHTQPKRNTHTIEIKLEVPQFEKAEAVAKKTHQKAKKLWQYRSFKFGVAGVFVVIVAVLTIHILSDNQSTTVAAGPDGSVQISKQDLEAKVPYYDALLPAGKTIEQLGGWTRSSPNDRNAGFVYVDYIRDNRLTINQQVLPEDFKVDTKVQMDAIAKSLSASEILTIEGLTVYIATSSKGPQTVIFNKDGLLVFLRSNVKLSNDDWIGYVTSLQ